MSSSLGPKQVTKNAIWEKAELEAQVKYLKTQLDQLMEEDEGGGPFWPRGGSNLDSKVDIPRFV